MFKGRFIIKEDSGVSEEVVQMTNELTNELMYKVKNGKRYIVKNGLMCYKGLLNFNVKKWLNGIDNLKISYVIFCIDNEQEYTFLEKQGEVNCSCDYDKGEMKLKLAIVDGKPSVQFKPQIAHEFNHIFQNDKGQLKNEEFYEIIADKYKNGNQWEKAVAWALYLTFKTEQSSFITQYYHYLKTSGTKKYRMDVYDKNNPYHQFQMAYDDVECFDLSDEDVYNSFGITLNKLYTILNSAEERLNQKTANVWAKYSRELEEKKNNRHIMPSPGRMMYLMECYRKGVYEEIELDF